MPLKLGEGAPKMTLGPVPRFCALLRGIYARLSERHATIPLQPVPSVMLLGNSRPQGLAPNHLSSTPGKRADSAEQTLWKATLPFTSNIARKINQAGTTEWTSTSLSSGEKGWILSKSDLAPHIYQNAGSVKVTEVTCSTSGRLHAVRVFFFNYYLLL